MANMFAYRWSWLPLSLLFYLDLSLFLTAQARRFGSNSKTIHLPETGSDLYNVDDRTRILKVDPNFDKNRAMSMLSPDETFNNDNVGDNKIRKKREASSPFLTNMTTEAHLKDSHQLMVVHWAGKNSRVIVALTKDSKPTAKASSSNVFISYNYGKDFENVSYKLTSDNNVSAIHQFHNHPRQNSHYVFVDITYNVTFFTRDYGKAFIKHPVPFCPRVLAFHSSNPEILLGMDDDDSQRKLYLTKNFGDSWTLVQENVKAFFWGQGKYDNPNNIYVERIEPNGHSTVVLSTNFFLGSQLALISGVEDFEIKDNYMFATKKIRYFGSSHPFHLQLWVSRNGGEFRLAQFWPQMNNMDYYIADASEDQVFVCVNHHNYLSNLFVSDVNGIKFSLSLERIIYFKPKGPNKDTWLSVYADKSFADIHKVKGVRGVYIASQFMNNSFNVDNQISLITFNKGGTWRPLLAPEKTRDGTVLNCSVSFYTHWFRKKWLHCSLHVSQELEHLYPNSHSQPILSRESAPGLIIAAGTVGSRIKQYNQNVFLSVDAGLTWHEILLDKHYFIFGDHGGLIVAIKQSALTDTILYSWNNGETWTSLKFTDRKIWVYGLLTEPGEKTTVFSIFGSYAEKHEWLIVQVNLSSIFKSVCSKEDYKLWSLSDTLKETEGIRGCLLGRKDIIEKRVPHAKCYNGEEYIRPIITKNCTCTREDFECDYGFKLRSRHSLTCETDPNSDLDIHKIPSPCYPGTYYSYTKGYRRIAGDSCKGGMEAIYAPQMNSCPVKEIPEFLLYAQRKMIHRYEFGSQKNDILVQRGILDAVVFDFDKEDNCIYWGDLALNTITRLCLDGNHSLEVLIEKDVSGIEGMAFDWSSGNIYWIDSGARKLEVVHKTGRFRRTLLRGGDTLDKPRSITLKPHYGYLYWTDWSSTNPRIVKASMDCRNITYIVQGKDNLVWPNGITIDHQMGRLYWTDAFLDQIVSSDLDGNDRKIIVKGNEIPHPYAIVVYKENIYWTDLSRQALLTANKNTGYGVTAMLTNVTGITDLKVVHQLAQSTLSACSFKNGMCSQLCVPRPHHLHIGHNNRTCLCQNYIGHILKPSGDEDCYCPHGETYQNGICKPNNNTCEPHQFQCHNSQCVSAAVKCDHDPDCVDGSDELNCEYHPCSEGNFRCPNMQCIPHHWLCNHENDCSDGSDEKNCTYPPCSSAEFTCNNGRCIPLNWTCDFDDDCHDYSDEANCEDEFNQCSEGNFHCPNMQCIPRHWICDHENDCSDGSDEKNCTYPSCSPNEFTCKNGRCILLNWTCDFDDDCRDYSDEVNCTDVYKTTAPVPTTTKSSSLPRCNGVEFQCDNGFCIFASERCDGINDCDDNSDEENCFLSPPPPSCKADEFQCTTDRKCILTRMQCDGHVDCSDRSDEEYCSSGNEHKCEGFSFRCTNGMCIHMSWTCDGENDCNDNSDEENCPTIEKCGEGMFHCLQSPGCIPQSSICNGINECIDHSDERDCYYNHSTNGFNKPPKKCADYEFLCEPDSDRCLPYWKACDSHIDCLNGRDEEFGMCKEELRVPNLWYTKVTSNSVLLSWEATKHFSSNISYMPSIVEVPSYTWLNRSITRKTTYNFTNLKPATIYYLFVSVKVSNATGSRIYSPVHFVSVKTNDGIPSKPVHCSVHQDGNGGLIASWKKPNYPRGKLIYYLVTIEDTSIGNQYSIGVKDTSQSNYSVTLTSQPLIKNHTFIIKILAATSSGDGVACENNVTYDRDGVISPVTGLTKKSENYQVTLSWNRVLKAKSYKVIYLDIWNAEHRIDVQKETVTINNLAPGCSYLIRIQGYNDISAGPPVEISVHTKGKEITTPNILAAMLVKNNSFNITWIGPSLGHHQRFAIFYDTIPRHLENSHIKDARWVEYTTSQFMVLQNLQACEAYIVKVAVVRSKTIPLSQLSSEILFQTSSDDRAPPKEVHVTEGTNKSCINITWQPPCSEEKIKQVYIIYINGSNSVSPLPPTDKKYLATEICNFRRGATYNISIGLSQSRLSIPVLWQVEQYSEPNAVKVVDEDPDKYYYKLIWNKINIPSHLFTGYQVVYKVGGEKDFQVYCVINSTSVSLNKLAKGFMYQLKVRLNKIDGYYGKFSSVASLAIPLTVKASSVNLVAIVVPISVVTLILVILGSILLVLFVRHKRLQRSFLAYASSHYDPRSERTTFNSAEYLGEDEDSPMITGFSDDEPLVIA
ncbi:sortilin-related receptor isoform X1 [Octopus bimaculoides]|uniref:sortilin-related receptor isoform X1 n=1 Tax=Octopus bimaculoides TaxID=37653 RepID=UPI00071E3522|nr:sortilin-related receptor isoform X1 [Octopus bimaculoides]|eukprot:XP_014768390.1 PREDICTED: sortilin-related receptor-like isoform X1 [Octopus bimaculoides]